MVKKANKEKFEWTKYNAGIFFLGVGFILFILNLTTVMEAIEYIAKGYSVTSFYTSIGSSMLLMGYSLYNIYTEEK